MALITVKTYRALGTGLVLAPERYDPRREFLHNGVVPNGVPLAELATTVRRTVSPAKNGSGRYLVLDTSDTREGIVIARKQPLSGEALGSAKKVAVPKDVIISRLRPYLRQVGYIDDGIRNLESGVQLVCSTEFYVLRSVDQQSIAFLVPFLLSDAVQEVLAASQEGGHHPRFNEKSLLSLPVPRSIVEKRDEISADVVHCALLHRESERSIAQMVTYAQSQLITSNTKT